MSDEEFHAFDRSNRSKENRKWGNKNARIEAMRSKCCEHEIKEGSFGDCDSFGWPKGPAMGPMLGFASNQE